MGLAFEMAPAALRLIDRGDLGAAGFEPLHSGIEIRQDSQPGAAGFEHLHLRSELPRLSAWGTALELARLGLQVREPHFSTSFWRPLRRPEPRSSADLISRCRGSSPAASS
jgi:hypothetical protein